MFLLPYLEMTQLANEADQDSSQFGTLYAVDTLGPQFWTRPDAWNVAQCRIANFVCPSDNPYSSAGTLLAIHFFYQPGVNGDRPIMAGIASPEQQDIANAKGAPATWAWPGRSDAPETPSGTSGRASFPIAPRLA